MFIRALVLLFMSSFAFADGGAVKVDYPNNYRDWSHIKSMVIFNKSHPLFDAFAGIHHVYGNKSAIDSLKKDAAFPKGATLAFDLLAIEEASGAYTEGKRKFLAVMVYDTAKYKDSKGWGWQVFADGDAKKPQLKTIAEQAACAACHTEVQSKHFVFTGWRK
ncbi:MAG: cytochrome P460 family protein [Bdellovibrionota bacterium]